MDRNMRPAAAKFSPTALEVSVESRFGNGKELIVDGNVEVECNWRENDPAVVTKMAAQFDKALAAAGVHCAGGQIGTSDERREGYFSRIIPVRMIPIEERAWIQRTATAWTLLSTSFSTDYLVPLLIGLAPVMFAMFDGIRQIYCYFR